MKFIFGFFLLLCIGLFVLMQWGGELTSSGQNSQLLGELNSEKIKLLNVTDAKIISASAVLTEPQTAPQKRVEIGVVAASAPDSASVTNVASDMVHATAPAMSPSLVVSAPSSTTLPPIKSATPTPPPSTLAPSLKIATKSCMEWGEFSGSDLERASKALAAIKLQDRMGSRTVEYASGFWVYVPPIASKAVLNKKINEIKGMGVDDYFVMREAGKWNNAISLGVFKTEEAAKKFLVLLKKKGVRSAKVGLRQHKLKFTVFTFKHVDAELSLRLNTLQKEFSSSELKTVPCNN